MTTWNKKIEHACIAGQHVWLMITGVREVNGWIIPLGFLSEEPFGHVRCLCRQVEWRDRRAPWILLKHVEPTHKGMPMADPWKAPDFAEHVSTLKRELLNAMQSPLARFIERTGVSPCAIDCQMMETTAMGEFTRQYKLTEVLVRFKL